MGIIYFKFVLYTSTIGQKMKQYNQFFLIQVFLYYNMKKSNERKYISLSMQMWPSCLSCDGKNKDMTELWTVY